MHESITVLHWRATVCDLGARAVAGLAGRAAGGTAGATAGPAGAATGLARTATGLAGASKFLLELEDTGSTCTIICVSLSLTNWRVTFEAEGPKSS